ncbi:MAG: sugar-binding transcriptional regulator [Anaerolineae bacterium]
MRDDALLFEIAKLHFEQGLSQAQVAEVKGMSRVKVNRLLQAARDRGIVRVLVVPRLGHAYLRAIEDELKAAYQLRDVLLVPGREEIHEERLDLNTQEAIVERLAYVAADYLDRYLTNDDVLCINWGRVMRSVVDHLRPSRTLLTLTVLPLLGSLSAQPEPFEANVLAQEIATAYGADFNWLIAPAIVRDPDQKRVAMELPLVKDTLAQIYKATMAITAIAPADPVDATVVKRGWLTSEEVSSLIERGAIGEICSWWFDEQGNEVLDEKIYPMGLGLAGLKRMVTEDKQVIAVVGADRARFEAIYAALIGKIVNVLITDHITAQYLIRRHSDPTLTPNSPV